MGVGAGLTPRVSLWDVTVAPAKFSWETEYVLRSRDVNLLSKFSGETEPASYEEGKQRQM